MILTGINHITLAVCDLDQSFHFYVTVLGLQPQAKWQTGAYLTVGETWFCLSLDHSVPAQDYSHIAFNIEPENFVAMRQHIQQHKVKEWKTNKSEGASLYILDPDGHQLEIHAGDLYSRLNAMNEQDYPGLQRYFA